MHRFLIPGASFEDGVARFPEAEAAHAFRVLRLEVGDEIELTDGRGNLFGAYLIQSSAEGVRARIASKRDGAEPNVRLTLYQGCPKKDKLEWIAQKATELGVSAIVPVRMARSVAKPGADDWTKKDARYARIIEEAVKQCGRAAVPVLESPISFAALCDRIGEHALSLVPWEEANETRLAQAHARHADARDIALVIGPEGGIDRTEIDALVSSGAIPVTLGPRILRTETAAIAGCACVMALWGDI